MTLFWILAGLMALTVAGLLVLALMRGARDTGPAEAFDLQVYRDQLQEVARDQARGVIREDEAERLRTEVSRRILAADAKAGEQSGTGQAEKGKWALGAVILLAVAGGGVGIYLQYGAPGYPDLPLKARIAMAEEARATRPSQVDAEAQVPKQVPVDVPADYMALAERLRAAVAERPEELQGNQLLARTEAALGNYDAAWQAQSRIVSIKGAQATAGDFADLADMMVLAAGGYVSPQAQGAVEQALARDPNNGVARYYGGLMMAQTGRPDIAFQMWDRLLRESRPNAPWVPPVRAQIEDLAFRAGISNYALPEVPTAPEGVGPSQEDIEAAMEMSAEDRAEMVEGMVARLSDRLATEGGPPEDWARLISALSILGRRDDAEAIWANAREVFAQSAESLETIAAAAAQAGLSQ